MRTVSAVIGANYGDEGKGLITDYLAKSGSLVVRFNGGAQAGHTVVTPEGRRHVFHHFGSGTFRDVPTFLSRFFISNPILLKKEWDELGQLGVKPKVFIEWNSPLTTPYDMMLNQAVERMRGTGKHGSCGLGINETIQRCKQEKFRTSIASLIYPVPMWNERAKDILRERLHDIRKRYVPQRAAELGVTMPDEWYGDGIAEHYIEDVDFLINNCEVGDSSVIYKGKWDHIIFEGAQGLRLDMDSTDFPYVTHSKTGVANVLAMLKEARIFGLEVDTLNAYYLTRCYTTRHGAGPLPHELDYKPYPKVEDATNIPNEWQGTLRFGWLDPDRVIADVVRDAASINVIPHLALTCTDQLDEDRKVHVRTSGGFEDVPVPELVALMSEGIRAATALVSSGPTRDHVVAYT